MTHTQKYYLYTALTIPFLGFLMIHSGLNPLLTFVVAGVTEVGFMMAGFELGRRDG